MESRNGRLSAYFKEQMLAGNVAALRGASLEVKVNRISPEGVTLSIVAKDKEGNELVECAKTTVIEGSTVTFTQLDMAFDVSIK